MSISTFRKRQRTFNPSRFRCCSFRDLCQLFTELLHELAAEAAVRDNYGAVVPAITLEIFDIS